MQGTLSVLLFATACAAGGAGGHSPYFEAASGPGCAENPRDGLTREAVAGTLDLDRVRGWAAERAGDPSLEGARSLVSIRRLRDGTDVVVPLQWRGAAGFHEEMVEVVRDALRDVPADADGATEGENHEPPRFFRLEVEMGTDPTLEIRPGWGCAPRHADADRFRQLVREASSELPYGTVLQALLRVQVMPDGRPGDIRVARSTGSSDLDRALVEIARRSRWIPARLDGVPIEVWAEFPVSMQGWR